ncbi:MULTISPECIES: hypothetical protein [Arthrobacter]|uniref:Uncharacterized protein n=2 Tax=Arthrobacter TaxID=1663 RepID=A0ABU9KR24_9MICC|nr:hypothetical protein [Arthrobacter sp. YJM1]MDP5228616.1 hypothetical protein [Arthrobacter sp. YJM1]
MTWTQTTIKTAAFWLAGIMLVAAAAIVTIAVVNAGPAGAQEPVRAYLSALQAGDGGKALGLLRAQVPAGNPSLLDGAALKAAVADLKDVKVGDPAPQADGRKTVPVSYTLHGSPGHTDFAVEPAGSEWLFFTRWQIVSTPLASVTVNVVNSNLASINGVTVNTPQGHAEFPAFFPGSYGASYTSPYFAAPAQTAALQQSTDYQTVRLSTAATKGLVDAVSAQVHQYLDDCAAKATKDQKLQPDCPFYHAGLERVVPGTVKWSLVEYPKVDIQPYNGRWVVSPLGGKARLQASAQDLFTGQVAPLEQIHPFSFNVALSFTPDKVTVTPIVDY